MLLWIFGFMGAHRFLYGKPITRNHLGSLTLGLFFIGWIVESFSLIPSMERPGCRRFRSGAGQLQSQVWVL